MKRTLLFLGALALLTPLASAQNPLDFDFVTEVRGDTLVVANFFDADGTASTLGSVISQDTQAYLDGDGNWTGPEGRVYLLTAGENGTVESGNLSLYLSDAAVGAQGRQITIVGEDCGLVVQGDDPTCRPPTIAGYEDAAEAAVFATFDADAGITLKNLHFTSASTRGQSNWSFINITGPNTQVNFENVIGEHNRWIFAQSNDNPGTELRVMDSYFINGTDQNSRRNGGVYDAVGVPTDVVWVENSTHVQQAGMQYKFRSFAPSQVRFNHNTFVNVAGQLFLGFGYFTDLAVTNNLFVNSNYQPYYPGLDRGEFSGDTPPGGFQPHGIINVAPLPQNDAGNPSVITTAAFPESQEFDEDDRQIIVDKNAAYWDSQLLTIADQLNADGAEGSICEADGCVLNDASLQWTSQAILANETTMSVFNDGATYPLIQMGEWYQEGAPGFAEGPGLVDALYDWGLVSASSGVTLDETLTKLRETGNSVNDAETNWVVFDWPVAVDLSYTNSTYLTGAYNDFPVGDLNWFPAEKEAWLEVRDAEYAEIEAALARGTLPFPVSSENGPSLIGRLGQNQPNPFSGETRIEFELTESSDVALEVYDALGRRVAVLAEGVLAAGPHSVEWDASSLSSGVYVYTLRTSSSVESRRMVIAR